jgi:hypothetical protein
VPCLDHPERRREPAHARKASGQQISTDTYIYIIYNVYAYYIYIYIDRHARPERRRGPVMQKQGRSNSIKRGEGYEEYARRLRALEV